MREILFRGKRSDNGEWIIGSLMRVIYENDIDGYVITDINFEKKDNGALAPKLGVFVPSYTIGQFTGLFDKNGNRIFEGDIIRQIFEEDGEKSEEIDIVLWSDSRDGDGVGWRKLHHDGSTTPLWSPGSEWEIIGNIFDNPNPELLGGDEDGLS